MSHFYRTEFDVWVGYWPVDNTENCQTQEVALQKLCLQEVQVHTELKCIYNTHYGNGVLQYLPLSVVQLKGKHCRKPHCLNGVVDNEVFILSGPCMTYGRPEAHASLSHSGCVLRQYLMFRKKRCHMLFWVSKIN